MKEENLVIEFQRSIDWLLERRKLPSDYVKRLQVLDYRQSQLIQELKKSQNNQITTFIQSLKNTENFLVADQIFQFLMTTEEVNKGKSLLGYFNSQILHDWWSFIKMYKKNNMFLASLGKILQQKGNYDLPGLQHELKGLQKQINDLNQREGTIKESINKNIEIYSSKSAKYQIQGVNLAQELRQSISLLPELYDKIQNRLYDQNISEILNYYEAIVNQTTPNRKDKDSFPSIKQIQKTTPLDIEALKLKYVSEQQQQDSNNQESNEFGVQNLDNIDYSQFGIEVTEGDQQDQKQNSKTEQKEEIPLIAQKEFRSSLLCEIYEIYYFLQVRSKELKSQQISHQQIEYQGEVKLSEWEKFIAEILQSLKQPMLQHFILLHTSQVYFQSILHEMVAQSNLIQRKKEQLAQNQNQKVQINKQITELEKQKNELKGEIQQLKERFEKEVSEIFKGYTAQVVGL